MRFWPERGTPIAIRLGQVREVGGKLVELAAKILTDDADLNRVALFRAGRMIFTRSRTGEPASKVRHG